MNNSSLPFSADVLGVNTIVYSPFSFYLKKNDYLKIKVIAAILIFDIIFSRIRDIRDKEEELSSTSSKGPYQILLSDPCANEFQGINYWIQ